MKFQKSIRTIINVCKLEPFLASLSVFLIMVASILELLGVGLILPIVNLNQNPVDDPSLLESILLGFFDLISLDPIIEYLLIMIVVLFILKSCLVYFVQRHIAFAVVRFGALRRIEFVEAITNSSWAYFSRNSVGSLINTLGQEAQTTQRCVSSVFNFLARILLNVGVSDYTNGFRIYSSNSVKLITKKCGNIGDGFIVLSEILLQIKLNNLKIDETSSIFVNRKRGESSVNFLLIVQSLIGVIKLYLIKNKILIN